MQIKYINVNEVKKTSDKSPDYRVTVVTDKDQILTVGAMWKSQYGYKLKLEPGVSFSGIDNLTPYVKKEDNKPIEQKEDNGEVPAVLVPMMEYSEIINPDDIPF